MNVTKKTHNTSVSCTGAQSIDIGQYQGQGVSGPGFAWPSSPLITTGALTQDYESLSIAALTTQSPLTTQTQEIQVRTVRIVEIAPTPPTPTVPNDDHTGAVTLTSNSTPLSASNKNATLSIQSMPSCAYYPIAKDVWFKFVATHDKHTIKVKGSKNVWYENAGIAIYSSSLSPIGCSGNDITAQSLEIGKEYYIRVWKSSGDATDFDFDISVNTTPANAITKITEAGASNLLSFTMTAEYINDSSIPASDITFEWVVYPGEIEPAANYSVDQGLGPHQIHVTGDEGEGDTTVRVKVRMKRISTNEPLTDWYFSGLVWFG